MWVPKLLLPPLSTGIFCPKSQIWSKICIFGHFLPNIGLSDPYGSKPDQNNFANEVPRWFLDMRVPELLLSPKTISIFGPETAIFGPKNAFLELAGSFGALLFGGCGVRAVYQDTHLLYCVTRASLLYFLRS